MALSSPPPPPLPSKQCWDEETLSGQAKVYWAAQTITLLGSEGGGEKERHIVSIVPRLLSPL